MLPVGRTSTWRPLLAVADPQETMVPIEDEAIYLGSYNIMEMFHIGRMELHFAHGKATNRSPYREQQFVKKHESSWVPSGKPTQIWKIHENPHFSYVKLPKGMPFRAGNGAPRASLRCQGLCSPSAGREEVGTLGEGDCWNRMWLQVESFSKPWVPSGKLT